eukprot:Skav225278  [mRNA]  locus=scaffold4099:196704:197790:- [translate_table: standard]
MYVPNGKASRSTSFGSTEYVVPSAKNMQEPNRIQTKQVRENTETMPGKASRTIVRIISTHARILGDFKTRKTRTSRTTRSTPVPLPPRPMNCR